MLQLISGNNSRRTFVATTFKHLLRQAPNVQSFLDDICTGKCCVTSHNIITVLEKKLFIDCVLKNIFV